MVNSNTRLWQMVDFMKGNHFPVELPRRPEFHDHSRGRNAGPVLPDVHGEL